MSLGARFGYTRSAASLCVLLASVGIALLSTLPDVGRFALVLALATVAVRLLGLCGVVFAVLPALAPDLLRGNLWALLAMLQAAVVAGSFVCLPRLSPPLTAMLFWLGIATLLMALGPLQAAIDLERLQALASWSLAAVALASLALHLVAPLCEALRAPSAAALFDALVLLAVLPVLVWSSASVLPSPATYPLPTLAMGLGWFVLLSLTLRQLVLVPLRKMLGTGTGTEARLAETSEELAALSAAWERAHRELGEAQRAAAAYQRRLEGLLGSASMVLFAMKPSGGGGFEFTYLSPSAENVLGTSRAPAMRLDWWQRRIHPKEMGAVREFLQDAVQKQRATVEFRMRAADDAWRWYFSEAAVVRDEAGRELEVLGIIVDISDSKETQNQLAQASKMVTLGEMATGIAHEINQPLNVIRLASQNALNRIKQGRVDADYLEGKLSRVVEQTKRAASIIEHMRVFGRKPSQDPEHFSVRLSVEKVLSLMQRQLELSDIAVHVEYPDRDLTVYGYDSLFEQVLLNLVVNARDAISSKAENLERDISRLGNTLQSEAGAKALYVILGCSEYKDLVRIRVRDTGGGIPEKALARIFEPFFTTKDVGKGTGLGLSISYGIISDMGGDITCRNVSGGAEFTITLPVSRPEEDKGRKNKKESDALLSQNEGLGDVDKLASLDA